MVRTSPHFLFTIIIPKRLASSADGRSEIFPPMNRPDPASGRMARGDGSRGGTRGSDSPLNRLFCVFSMLGASVQYQQVLIKAPLAQLPAQRVPGAEEQHACV